MKFLTHVAIYAVFGLITTPLLWVGMKHAHDTGDTWSAGLWFVIWFLGSALPSGVLAGLLTIYVDYLKRF
jgi:TRAP-type C4-dicarboxylate transport system permease small subunit